MANVAVVVGSNDVGSNFERYLPPHTSTTATWRHVVVLDEGVVINASTCLSQPNHEVSHVDPRRSRSKILIVEYVPVINELLDILLSDEVQTDASTC
ncbi:hypothetical protein P3T76_008301 [Phytophthora citrophthora]|uniref:Uncharacterized protein n=1 Tax=Phytophthora citrophthora TaxID=4793 RepID=A0AAD9GK90_9STRA|nr:hypothetical protein P3T76_008293 [Phytophthora citrophthora]KAK1939978.1 hypothetical protein P3T76_008301 [Phytophthora citrophthora]